MKKETYIHPGWPEGGVADFAADCITVHMYTEHPRADTNLSRLNGVRDDERGVFEERGELVQTYGRRLK